MDEEVPFIATYSNPEKGPAYGRGQKQIARPSCPERAEEITCDKRRLAAGLGGFFLLRLFLLFFFLQLISDDLEDGHLGAVANADARRDDACVASRSVGKFWRDLAEKLLCYVGRHDVGSGLAA